MWALLCAPQAHPRHAGAGERDEALALVEEHAVAITEELAEQLTPAQGRCGDEARHDALRRVAKAARKQGLFQLAAKVYAQVRAPPRARACRRPRAAARSVIPTRVEHATVITR